MKGILWHGLRNYRGKLYWILENRKIEFVYWASMLKQIAKKEGRKL